MCPAVKLKETQEISSYLALEHLQITRINIFKTFSERIQRVHSSIKILNNWDINQFILKVKILWATKDLVGFLITTITYLSGE